MLSLEWTFPSAPVGRAAEQGALFARLTNEPLITIVGSRGSGKTTLAQLVLARLSDPVYVPLRGVSTAEGVRAHIAGALGIVATRDDELTYFLRRQPRVLYLDHIDEALTAEPERVRPLLAAIAAVPFVHVLVTSRQPIGIGLESVFRLGPLDDAAAAKLLPGYVPVETARRLLLSHPLALRLAAPLLLVDAETLWSCLEMAVASGGDVDEAVLDALSGLATRHLGYADLDATSLQYMLTQLPAGATETELNACISGDWRDMAMSLEHLAIASWERNRLVTHVPAGRERLSPALTLMVDHLDEYFSHQARRLHDALSGYGWRDAMREFIAVAPNLIQWLSDRPQSDGLGVYLPRLLAHAGCRVDAELMARRVAERSRDTGNRRCEAWSALTLGDLALGWADWDDARRQYAHSRACFEAIGDGAGTWNALMAQAELAIRLGYEDDAVGACAGALQIATRNDDLRGQAEALRGLGKGSRRRGEPRAVREAYEYARSLFERAGDTRGVAACSLGIGEVALREGKLEEAFDAYVRALDIHRAARADAETATVLLRLGEIVLRSGDAMRATMVMDEALVLFRKVGEAGGEAEALMAQRRALIELEMPEAAFAALHLAREAYRALKSPRAGKLDTLFETAARQLMAGAGPKFLADLVDDAEQIRFNGVEEARTVLRLQDKIT